MKFVMGVTELYFVDAREELFEVELNDGWILGLPQDLEHVVVSQEVETREFVSLFLQVVVEGFLASFELGDDVVEGLLEAGNGG